MMFQLLLYNKLWMKTLTRISSTSLNITKLDILDSFPSIKVATGYRDPESKEKIEGFPADLKKLEELEPIYEVFQGWLKPIGHCRSFDDLPPAVSIF